MYDIQTVVAAFCCGFLIAQMIEMIRLCREIRKLGEK
jgi:hypothetical protein